MTDQEFANVQHLFQATQSYAIAVAVEELARGNTALAAEIAGELADTARIRMGQLVPGVRQTLRIMEAEGRTEATFSALAKLVERAETLAERAR